MGSGIKLKKLELIHIRAARLIYKLPKCMKDDDTLARVSRICLFHYAPYHINIAGDAWSDKHYFQFVKKP